MSNIDIAIKLIKVMDPSSVTDEAIKQAVLALLGEAEPKAEPKKKAAAPKEDKPKKTVKRGLDHGKICALYKAGWSIKAIAEEMGSVDGTIRYHLQREGLIK